MIEIILVKDIGALGKMGDVVQVKNGYARNYLIPRKLAYHATTANLKRIEQQKAKEAKLYASERQEAEELAKRLSKTSCTVTVEVNDLEKLYGSVSEVDVVQALEVEGISIDKKAVVLEKPIEELGIFEVGIKLHPEVLAKIRLWVAKK